MKASNAAIDLAERRVEQERAAGIRRVQAALGASGVFYCLDCEDPIPEDRRVALPAADRCLQCQTLRERQNRMRA